VKVAALVLSACIFFLGGCSSTQTIYSSGGEINDSQMYTNNVLHINLKDNTSFELKLKEFFNNTITGIKDGELITIPISEIQSMKVVRKVGLADSAVLFSIIFYGVTEPKCEDC